MEELDVVDQLTRADPLLAKATFHFGGLEHRVEEVHCRGVILLGGGAGEHLDPMGFCLVSGQARGRELVVAELAGEHLVD